jgi:cation transporter-like permease
LRVNPAKVIASTMGLAGFAVALLAGLGADNPTESILGRAIISLLVCHVVGYALGVVGESAIRRAVDPDADDLPGTAEEKRSKEASNPRSGEAPLAA